MRIWTSIGLQSFGGGNSTLFLIQREFTEKQSWISSDEFMRFWSLCLMTPGINLIALTILIGHKLRGVRGMLVSLTGLLLPSVIITCLLTAGYQSVQHVPAIQAMLRGVIPATGGILLLIGVNFGQPLLKQVYKESKWKFLCSLALIASVALLLILFKLAVAVVLVGAALVGMGFFTFIPSKNLPPDTTNARKKREETEP